MTGIQPLSESERYGNFLHTLGVKCSKKVHRVSYRGTNIDIPTRPTVNGYQRGEVLWDLSHDEDLYESLTEHYYVDSDPEEIEEFLEGCTEFKKLDQLLESGRLSEEDQSDLENLLDDKVMFLGSLL